MASSHIILCISKKGLDTTSRNFLADFLYQIKCPTWKGRTKRTDNSYCCPRPHQSHLSVIVYKEVMALGNDQNAKPS